jgi:hypothetical protein
MLRDFCYLVFIITVLLLSSCLNDKSKKEHKRTTVIAANLFVETYTIFGGGAGGGDRVSQYLTDSLNFRIYTGTFIEGDNYNYYECVGDSIKVHRFLEGKKSATKAYSLAALKNDQRFE